MQVVERVAPKDTVWTYNNVTHQPAKTSTYCNRTWDARRQTFIPSRKHPQVDTALKHSPRELLQMVKTTPRGSRMPHLLTTPRAEHLYEGDDIDRALRVRDRRRREIETLYRIRELDACLGLWAPSLQRCWPCPPALVG